MFDYYKMIFKGVDVSQNDFDRYLRKAKALVDYYTFNRINWDEMDGRVKNCLCELVEVIKRDEDIKNGKVVKSESVGAYKVDYVSSSNISFDDTALTIIKLYLLNTGLMFRG